MPSLYESTVNTGEVSSSNFTTLYNASGLSVPNAGAGSVTGNLNVGGNLTVQGSSLLIGEVTLQSTLSLPNYTFPLPDGTTDQVLVTDGSGNLYWSNVQALPGASYSIEANSATGGANLTLVSAAGSTDSVKFAGGTNITVSQTDASTITISTVADNIPDGTANGQMLVWENSAWTATPNVIWDTTATNRTTITGKIPAVQTGRSYSTMNLINDTGSTAYTSGDGGGVLFAVDSDSQAANYYATVATGYYSGQAASQVRLNASSNNFATATATSITGGNTLVFATAHGFTAGMRIRYLTPTTNGLTQDTMYAVLATGLTTTQCQISLVVGGSAVALTDGSGLNLIFQNSEDTKRLLNIDKNTTRLNSPSLVLRANASPTAAGDATISVVRGLSGADAALTWTESAGKWIFSTGMVANGDTNIIGVLNTTGNIYTTAENISMNNDSTAADSYLNFKGTTQYLKWNNGATRFDLSNSLNVIGDVTGSTSVVSPQFVVTAPNFSSITLGGTLITTSTAQTSLVSEAGPLMKIILSIKDNVTNAIHGVELLAIQSGSTVMLTTYAELYTSSALATFAVDQSGGVMRLLVTPASTNSTSFSYLRTAVEA